MNKKFLVSYDLIKRKDYPKLWEALDKLGAVRVLASQWVLSGKYSCTTLREHFQQFIDADDRLLVVDLSADWSSWNTLTSINDVAA